MTHPDLEREIADLLQLKMRDEDGTEVTFPYEGLRDAILAYVQRKLDEARADSDLLATVEALLATNHFESIELGAVVGGKRFWAMGLRPKSLTVGRWIEIDRNTSTLVEALRKLVEIES